MIYKFRDTSEGRYAFVWANSLENAKRALARETSLKFTLVAQKEEKDLSNGIVLRNDILPF